MGCVSRETLVGDERLPGPRKVPATQGPRERIGTNSATPVSGAGEDTFAEDFRGRVWRERKSPGGCAATSEVGPGSGAIAAPGWDLGVPSVSRKEDARWDGGGLSAGTPGRAAMNLERLRKRVRQYLDQGKGPEGRDPVPQPSLQPGGALKMKAT